MRCALLLATLLCASPAWAESDAAHAPEMVVLLHGLGRTDRSMQPLANRLSEAGYDTHNLRYPSTQLTPDALVSELHEQLTACCGDASRLHFVTHSLGGVLVRAYAAKHASAQLGRVVMLAPPNGGSEYVDAMQEWEIFHHAVGPTGGQLGTGPDSLPNRLPAPTFEFGVIAGTRNPYSLSRHVIPGASDGTVSVESTQLEGMTDFITVDEMHTFIMLSPEVAHQTIAFLRTGRFAHDAGD